MIRIALAIVHADFDPVRRRSMERLRSELRIGDPVLDLDDGRAGLATVPVFGRIPYREETGRASHVEWSERLWKWAAAQGADWAICLQDDVLVAPDFWLRFEKAVESLGADGYFRSETWINLLANHPGSRRAFVEGREFYQTLDGVIGVGYAASSAEFGRLRDFRDLEVLPGQPEKLSEDVLASLYCLANARPVLTPLPGLIDHDLEVGTLHPTEHQQNRRAFVRWDDEDRRPPVERAIEEESVAFLGRFYETAYQMLPGVLVDGLAGARQARAVEDMKCPPEYGKLFELIVAQGGWP